MQFRTKLGLVDIPNEEVLSAARDIAGSERSPSEIAAPSGSLGVGGGSLPVSEAEALSQLWMGRSLKGLAIARENDKAGRDTLAWCNHVRSAAYLLCADELRQRAGLPTSRQPEENSVSPAIPAYQTSKPRTD